MQVGGINGGSGLMAGGAASPAQDAVSRSIKNQIAELQKQMQQLSSGQSISAEEKMKKRQELQKQISELNRELRQHQMEVQKEERQKAAKKQDRTSEVEGLTGGKASGGGTGISNAGMQSIISADASVKQAEIRGSAARQAQGRANVLKAEIKQDGPSKSTEAKEEQLAETEQNVANILAAQGDTLAKANEAIQEAGSREEDKAVKPEAGKVEEEKEKEREAVKEDSEKDKTAQTEGRYVDVRL